MKHVVSGRCWSCGDSVTVYQIVDESHWTMDKLDGEAMGNWVFEKLEPSIEGKAGAFKQLGYQIVIAGNDFGCGSKSVEHPMAALKGAGIQLILAESVSRYSYRNALNYALPVLICPGIQEHIKRDDIISADLVSGEIRNHTTGKIIYAEGLSEFAMHMISAGGLLNFARGEAEQYDN